MSTNFGKTLNMSFIVGNFGNAFYIPMIQGFNDACKEWGVNGTFTGPTTGDYPSVVNAIYAAIATKPDGLIVPQLDPTFYPAMEQAASQGIVCLAANALASPLPSPTANPQPYLAYIGANDTLAGQAAGNEVASLWSQSGNPFGITSDSVAVSVNDEEGQSSGDARAAALLATLKSFGITTDQTGGPNGGSGSNMEDLCSSYFSGHPNTKALLADSGNGWGIGSFIQSQGLTGKVIGGGWDLVSQELQFISQGVMQYTVDQKPYFQGYYPVYGIWEYINSSFAYGPANVNTGGGLVDSSNIATILKERPNG